MTERDLRDPVAYQQALRYCHLLLTTVKGMLDKTAAQSAERAAEVETHPLIKAVKTALAHTPRIDSDADFQRFEADSYRAMETLDKEVVLSILRQADLPIQFMADRMASAPEELLEEWNESDEPPFDPELARPLLNLLEQLKSDPTLRKAQENLLESSGNTFTALRKAAATRALSDQAHKAGKGRHQRTAHIKGEIRGEYAKRRNEAGGKRINKAAFALEMLNEHQEITNPQTITKWCREWDKSLDRVNPDSDAF